MIHLDTNILIAMTQSDPKVDAWIIKQTKLGKRFRVSSVTWYEFLTGPVEAQQIQKMEIILDSQPIPFDSSLAAQTASLFNTSGRARKRKVDAMIAATAILHGGILATRNTADFLPFQDLGLTLLKV
jgi:predicted nucleic acid-binding protein